MMLRRLLLLGSICVVPTVGAQSIFDIGARIAPQFHSYKLDTPSNLTISEFAVPIYVLIPIASRVSFDIGTSYTRARVEQSGANGPASEINGLTDTQLRGNVVLGNDFVVLTAGVNLPTGQAEVNEAQLAAARFIGNEFLALPISNMGTGFGGTGGVAVARPFHDWNFGFGFSMRRSGEYTPQAASTVRYQPGNEYRGRIGIDRPVGTGQVQLGFTYSKFADDNLGGSIFNTGDRYIGEFNLNNNSGAGRLSILAWNLFRTKGTSIDTSSVLDNQNITNGSIAYGIPLGETTMLEPNIEGRTLMQPDVSTSYMGTVGLRLQADLAGFSIVPSVAYSIGKFNNLATTGAAVRSDLTGFHGTLTIRIR